MAGEAQQERTQPSRTGHGPEQRGCSPAGEDVVLSGEDEALQERTRPSRRGCGPEGHDVALPERTWSCVERTQPCRTGRGPMRRG